LGVAAGNGLARYLVESVTRAMSQQYQQKIDASTLQFTSGMFLSCVLIGIGASLFGSLVPALKAMKIQPLEAMKSKDADEFSGGSGRSKSNHHAGILGLALLAVAVVISYALRGPEYRVFSVIGEIAAIVGAALLGPVLLTTLIQAVQPQLQGKISMPFRLAIDNLLRNPRRTGANVISLLVGLVLVVILSCVTTSFKGTLVQFFNQVLHADMIISATGRLQSHETQFLDESLKGEIDQVPGVLGAYELQEVKFNYEGSHILLKNYGEPPAPEKPGPRYDIFSMRDADTEAVGPVFFHSSEPVVMVSDNFVLNFHKHTGEWIDLPIAHGKVAFRIIGTVRDFANPQGVILMSRAEYLQYFGDHLVSGFAVKIKDGQDAVSVRREIENRLGRKHQLTILLNDDIRSQIGTTIDHTFAYTNTIKLAALLVALFGLLNTLLVSVLERKRELGLARAVGMTRGEIRKMILIEAGSQGAIGALIAIALGTSLGALWVKRTLADSLGWIVDFYVPWPALITTFGLGLLVTLMAAWYPARQAARLEIVEAIEYE
jgi:putative ABC transport system permease protein